MWLCRNPAARLGWLVDRAYVKLASGFMWLAKSPVARISMIVDKIFVKAVRRLPRLRIRISLRERLAAPDGRGSAREDQREGKTDRDRAF